MEGEISYAVYNFPCINVYGRCDDGLKLLPKHVAVNKLPNFVCD
jgi:hypothetical protein